MRARCQLLVAAPESAGADDASVNERLLESFVAADRTAIAAAASALVAVHRRAGVALAETLG